MGRLLAFAVALGLSLMVAYVAIWRLVEHFWYGEDLDLFIPPVAGFVLIAAEWSQQEYFRRRSRSNARAK